MEPPVVMSRIGRTALHACTVVVALVGITCLGASRRSFSGTFDEGNHLAAGLEWWQFGTYTMWTENPPLPRLAIAALPYIAGMRLPPREQWEPKTHEWDRSWEIGTDLLYAGDGFEKNLRRARLGTLPFFLITLGAAWGLAGGRRRPAAGLFAVALTATLPALIAHGALATTDVAFAGMFLLAILTLARWFETPTVARALVLGAAVGLALLAKFSTLIFFPVAVIAFAIARGIATMPARPVRDDHPIPWAALAGQAGLALLAALLVTWAGYRFSLGRMDALAPQVKDWLDILPPVGDRHGLTGFLLRATLPMPELFHGLRFLAAHDAVGHEAYLLGKVSEHGFLAFYPIALLVKTPLPFLALLLVSMALLAHRRPALWLAQATALAALGILLVSLRSHVNLGIRHVFVLLPLLAVAIARATDQGLAHGTGLKRPTGGTDPKRLAWWPGVTRLLPAAVVGALLLAQTGIAIAARSKELGYFNALAGSDPATILLDSDLDWGQDLFALRRETRARGIDALSIAFFGTLRLCRHDLPRLRGLVPGLKTTGWIAISENYYRHRSTFMLLKDPCNPKSTYRSAEVPPQPFAWLRAHTPVAIVGSSIRLYHIMP
jgi:4-amino-4-deoxy-L-arabinose transferase-like glycosyltransferase